MRSLRPLWFAFWGLTRTYNCTLLQLLHSLLEVLPRKREAPGPEEGIGHFLLLTVGGAASLQGGLDLAFLFESYFVVGLARLRIAESRVCPGDVREQPLYQASNRSTVLRGLKSVWMVVFRQIVIGLFDVRIRGIRLYGENLIQARRLELM